MWEWGPAATAVSREAASREHFFLVGIAAVGSLLGFEHLRSESVSRPKPLASFFFFFFCLEVY